MVAERKYDWQRGRNAGTLTVRIGAPQRDSRPGFDWVCPVQFLGAPRGFGLMTAVRPIYGVDQLQALTLALRFVEITLGHVAPALNLTVGLE